jgi:hypothetical protein
MMWASAVRGGAPPSVVSSGLCERSAIEPPGEENRTPTYRRGGAGPVRPFRSSDVSHRTERGRPVSGAGPAPVDTGDTVRGGPGPGPGGPGRGGGEGAVERGCGEGAGIDAGSGLACRRGPARALARAAAPVPAPRPAAPRIPVPFPRPPTPKDLVAPGALRLVERGVGRWSSWPRPRPGRGKIATRRSADHRARELGPSGSGRRSRGSAPARGPSAPPPPSLGETDEHHRELPAAPAADEVGVTEGRRQAACDLHEHAVALGVPVLSFSALK